MSEADPAAIIDFFRSKHPIKTAENVSANTGVPVRTVEKLLERCSAPSYSNFIKFIMAYGLDLLNAAIGDDVESLTAEVRAKQRAELKAEQERIAAELARLDRRR